MEEKKMEPIKDCDIIERLEDFKLLRKTDEQLRMSGNLLLNNILSRGICKYQPNALKNMFISGSFSEGATVARFFKLNAEFDDELNRELEMDIELTAIKIRPNLKHYVEDIPDQYGFVKVRADSDMIMASNIEWDVSKHKVEELEHKMCKNGYIQPFKTKTYAFERSNDDINKDTYSQKFVELFFAVVYNEKVSEMSIKRNGTITNASVEGDYYVQIKEKNVLFFYYDLVVLLEIGWWPDVALEWKNRKREWPKDQSIIDDLTKSCFIIAKSTASEKNDKDSYTWRYSFSNIERKLISMRSAQQNLVYLIFKAMFYKWLKPISSTQIFSFVAKNIMLKTCEEFPPEHQMWNESYQSTKEALLYLFLQAHTAFENGKLEYYFVNKINVIESVEPLIKEQIKLKIIEIVNSFETHVLLNVVQVNTVAEDMIAKISAFNEILNKAKSGDYSDFLNLEFLVENFNFLLDEKALRLYKDLFMDTLENKLKMIVSKEVKVATTDKENVFQNIKEKIQEEFTSANSVIGAVATPAAVPKILNEIQMLTKNDEDIAKVGKKLFKFFR